MSIKKGLRVSMLTGILSIGLIFYANMLQAQMPMVDKELADSMGKAAQTSNGAAYILGVISVFSMGLAGWSINKRDDTIKNLNDLTQEIRIQNESNKDYKELTKAIATSLDTQSKKPCALDNKMLEDLLKGKFKT